MKEKVVTGIMLTLLFVGMLTLTFTIQPIEASSEETVVHYTSSHIENVTSSYDDNDPVFGVNNFSGERYWTFSPPDANGVINLTIPKESGYLKPTYNPATNITVHGVLISDSRGKMYTLNGTGDVDIKSMTNDTGMFFWKDGAWHPPGEEWLGDGTPDPAGSAWMTHMLNTSVYRGNGTDGLLLGSFSWQNWVTTGFSENTVVEPASRLNGFYVNATGRPFSSPFVGATGTWVYTGAKLNIPFWQGKPLDIQFKTDQLKLTPYVEIPIKGGENATIEGNVTITNALVTKNTLHFDVSGPSGSTGWINVTFPMVNTTEIKVFINNVKLTPPPFPMIITNGTHYFIYFEFTLSTHTITIQFGPEIPVGGIYIRVNKLELLAPYIGLTILLAVAVTTVVYIKKRKRDTKIIS